MAGTASDESGVGSSVEGSGQQRCQSSEALAEWRSSEQVENGLTSTSPPYWDTEDEDDFGPKPSELYGRYTWKIDKFSQINKRELRSNAFEVGGYKWYILIYPQGCDVCNHLSLFLCVANHDKLLPGWSHFAQFTIAVVNKDPKKSKYSDTLHRFWKKEHDWGWKKFMELSKVLDGFIDADTLIIKAQVQVIRERADRPFRCLDCQYRRELVRVYLTNVEQIARRFVEERRGRLKRLIEDKARWPSFCAFWLGLDPNARRRMSREKTESVLKVVVKHFFIEKEVTSTLVMDSLHSGLKALQGQTKSNKAEGIYLVDEEPSVPIARMEKDTFILVDDVLLLLTRAAVEPLPPKDEKGPQNRTKDGSSGEDFSKDSIVRDERRLTELGRRTIEIFVLAHIFSSKIEVAYQEAVALKRQEELIREEEAAYLAGSEKKMRRGVADKDKKSKKKQGKQKKNSRKVKDKGRYDKPDNAVEDKPEHERNDFLVEESEPVSKPIQVENVSDVSDSVDCSLELPQADSENGESSPVNWDTDTSEIHPTTGANSSGISAISSVRTEERKSPSGIDDSSSTCSTDSLPSVTANGPCKGSSLVKQNSQKSSSRGRNLRVNAIQEARGRDIDCNIKPSNASSDPGQVIDSSGNGKVAKPEKAVSNSLQHRTEQVTKKEVAGPDKKSTVTEVTGIRKPIKVKTTTTQTSPGRPVKDLSSAPESKLQLKTASSIDTVLVSKQSSLRDQKSDKMAIPEISAESAVPRVTEKSISQHIPFSSEKSKCERPPGTSEKHIAQQVPVKSEKPMPTQPGILRPLSAPLIPGTEVGTPVVPVVQTAQSLSRSVSAAGRLNRDSSPATTSHVPQSYRNAMMGNQSTASSTGYSLSQSSNSEVNSQHSYLQTSSVISPPMYTPQSSRRLDTESIRSDLLFGMVSHDVLQNVPQWMENHRMDSSRSNSIPLIHNGPQWMEDVQQNTSRSINNDHSLHSDIQNFDMVRSAQSRSQDQFPIGYPPVTSGRQNPGVSSDDFPHLDIINNLLDDENGIFMAATTSSGFQTFSNGPHHLNQQQFTFPGDFGLSGDLGPSGSPFFEQTQSYHDDDYYQSYNFASDQFDSNWIHQANLQPYQNEHIDGLVPNQWQVGDSDPSYLSMRSSENDNFSYHIPEYSNLVCGTNGYTVFRPSSGH
ncbi:TNF receptor-associated factor homolog 1a isoform X3 [Daucus carota subsp. sativus]|uniref:TNF receptor-associated factor homolog 1a isoform X3 n=1 Tax=Daucus carota subsp. sativus TaxID=79200 RepID=UPI0007EF9A0A|nr:PREDICTED: MATH domain-containing protein At5g43560-like isoform X3 [Daucus carota subsp. sativus]